LFDTLHHSLFLLFLLGGFSLTLAAAISAFLLDSLYNCLMVVCSRGVDGGGDAAGNFPVRLWLRISPFPTKRDVEYRTFFARFLANGASIATKVASGSVALV